jgi:hypothetical protein
MEAKKMVKTKPSEVTEPIPLVGVFDPPNAAERAYDLLLEKGYTHDEVNVLMSAETRKVFRSGTPVVASADGTEVPEATGKVLGGAGAMSAAGALSGVVAGVGASLVIPGLGLFVAGPLAALGASLGAALGAMYGIPFTEMAENEIADRKTEVRDGIDYGAYGTKLREGKVLISVVPHSPEDRDQIQRDWDGMDNSPKSFSSSRTDS